MLEKKIRVIRHVKQIIWQETYKSLDFLKIHSQNRVREVHGFGSKMSIFEANFFSNASRKFSMRRMIMFNIFGRLSNIISLRSKKNQSHTTHRSKDIGKKPLHFEKKPVQTIFPGYHCSQYAAMIKRIVKDMMVFQRIRLANKLQNSKLRLPL